MDLEPMGAKHDITALLVAWRAGGDAAADHLFPLLYQELRRIAHRQLARERSGHTLSTTALVHEAYLELVDQSRAQWVDRAHFLAVAARVMRRVLLEYARQHRAEKRGGGRAPVVLDDALAIAADARADALIETDDALERLAAIDERLARVVECRFFGGLTDAETAEALGITERTVRRDWVKAKLWLAEAFQR